MESRVHFYWYMQLVPLADRIVRTRAFQFAVVVCAVLCIVSGTFAVRTYQRYSRMIDQRLNGHVFENTAKIYDSSGKLLSRVSGQSRAKRRLVEFSEIPKMLIAAVTAGEDQKFFAHYGVDLKRIAGAFIWNLHEKRRLQGASTITQQLARSFFLTREPTLRRKFSEAFIAVLLELRLSKEQIFTLYANEVYLGERGLYAMHGFGEAAQSLFGKDLRKLTLAETATLAGIIPAPNYFSPVRHPDRALVRRQLILKAMRQSESITEEEYRNAKNAKVEIIQSSIDNEAPYFVDFARDELLKDYTTEDVMYGGYNVYTALDLDLQKAAVDAVANGLTFVDRELAARNEKDKTANRSKTMPRPQAALIALDPHTGEIKAMVGGSNYATSQYNRISQAFRQPGSVFKPFVYAAALETAYDVRPSAHVVPSVSEEEDDAGFPSIRAGLITPLTQIMDAPRTFTYDGGTYEPSNFKGGFAGLVTLRTALQKSLNSAAVQVAERIGYRRVADFAHRLGLNQGIQGYPSIALGAFEVTPIELAGAYTAFANQGRRMEPHAVRRVETAAGVDVTPTNGERQVLQPELAYLMTYLMEGVMNRGTAAGVRSRGFRLPAAGKTGTSRDGWFVGYTKDLLVITWVGFDDNRDLGLEGSRSALPIWADFMLKAYTLYPPDKRMNFTPPPGIEFVTIDAESGLRATPDCIDVYQEAFIRGTAPTAYCPLQSPEFAGSGEPAATTEPTAKASVVSAPSPDVTRKKP
jgi:penicillin-binding protein 1B